MQLILLLDGQRRVQPRREGHAVHDPVPKYDGETKAFALHIDLLWKKFK